MDRLRIRIAATMILAFTMFATACSGESDTNQSGQPDPTKRQETSVAGGATSSNSDWSRFRGPTGMGFSNAKELAVSWSAEKNIAWKTPLPGAGASSPIVFGDHIYLTSYTGYFVPGDPNGSLDELERHLICLKRSDGTVLWKKSVKAKLPEEKRIRDHGYAGNTPAADADRVYAFFGKSGVFAYDHEGKQLWQTDVGSNTSGWGTAASPVLYKDFVFINASVESESLIALDRRTGKEKWRARGIKESWNTPLVVETTAGNDELVLAIHGEVLGFACSVETILTVE